MRPLLGETLETTLLIEPVVRSEAAVPKPWLFPPCLEVMIWALLPSCAREGLLEETPLLLVLLRSHLHCMLAMEGPQSLP